MVEVILKTAINYLVPLLLGYLISRVATLKKKNKATDVALRTLLQNNLTNTYFVYDEHKAIPDYVYKNWLNMLHVYEDLGGNDYCHMLAKKMETWDIVQSDILSTQNGKEL